MSFGWFLHHKVRRHGAVTIGNWLDSCWHWIPPQKMTAICSSTFRVRGQFLERQGQGAEFRSAGFQPAFLCGARRIKTAALMAALQ